MNYTKAQLQKALIDFEQFVKMTKNYKQGTPIRLKIARDLIKYTLKGGTFIIKKGVKND